MINTVYFIMMVAIAGSEFAKWIPEIIIGGMSTIIVISIKRYLSGQDKRYEALAADLKKFSKELISSIETFREVISTFKIDTTSQHTLCNSRHENTDKHLKRIDKDIDELVTKTDENINEITKINAIRNNK